MRMRLICQYRKGYTVILLITKYVSSYLTRDDLLQMHHVKR